MKKNRYFTKLFIALAIAGLVLGCSDDESPVGTGTDFSTLASTHEEADGTITIPLRGGSVSADDITFLGTATEGEDFTLVGVSGEGIQLSITDDDTYEAQETIKVKINTTGNNVHTVTIVCDGDDSGGYAVANFAGVWHATEDYGAGGTFGPYNVTFVQDGTDPNKFKFSNFYGSGSTYTAYVVFDVAAGTVSFPDQTVGAPTYDRGPLTASTGTFNLCEETLTINLTYDGGPWVYRFARN